MNVKNLLLSFLLLFTLLIITPKTYAEEKSSDSSANFSKIIASMKASDGRAKVLKAYLERYNSPLAPYAKTFITAADQYNLDWRLVAAISGVESTFGKAEPVDCYNGWGFGIYGTQTLCFPTYREAIFTISKSLRQQYMDKWGAADVYAIGHYYAASPTWASRVSYFMADMENYRQTLEYNQPLSISL